MFCYASRVTIAFLAPLLLPQAVFASEDVPQGGAGAGVGSIRGRMAADFHIRDNSTTPVVPLEKKGLNNTTSRSLLGIWDKPTRQFDLKCAFNKNRQYTATDDVLIHVRAKCTHSGFMGFGIKSYTNDIEAMMFGSEGYYQYDRDTNFDTMKCSQMKTEVVMQFCNKITGKCNEKDSRSMSTIKMNDNQRGSACLYNKKSTGYVKVAACWYGRTPDVGDKYVENMESPSQDSICKIPGH